MCSVIVFLCTNKRICLSKVSLGVQNLTFKRVAPISVLHVKHNWFTPIM